MKKNLIIMLTLLLTFTLSACTPAEAPIKVLVPNGAPALAQTAIEYGESRKETSDFDIELVFGADLLATAFATESHEIIFAPTNLGARLFTAAGASYRLAATVTWGNLFIASKQPLDGLESLDGKKITVFGENATPDIVFRSLLGEVTFTEAPQINYVDAVDMAASELETDPDSIVMLAEPAMSVVEMRTDETLNVIDLQAAWQTYFDQDSYPQAGVFIHKDLSDDIVADYLERLQESIALIYTDLETVLSYAETLDYPFPTPVLREATPRSNIRYVDAADSKNALEFFFNRILELQPALIGGTLPDDNFYYRVDGE